MEIMGENRAKFVYFLAKKLNYFLPKVILSSAFLDHLNDPEKFFSALI
jgi:hypothetical protein